MSEILERIGNEKVEWKRLGDVGKFFAGLTGKTKYDFVNGNSKYVPYKNIFSNIEVDLNYLEEVSIGEEKQNKLKYGDVLFTGSSENKDECGLSSVITKNIDELYLNSFCFGYRFNEDIKILPSFSKYLFRDYRIRKEIIKISSGVTRYNVSKEGMKNIEIPIPSLETQEKIVKILDKFQKYASELQHELQHELQLRIKHYEYYRDLALSEVWLKKQIELLNKYIKGEITLEERKYENYRNLIFDELLKLEYTTIGEISEGGLTYGSGTTSKEYDGKTRYVRITDIDEDGGLKEEKVSPSIIEEKYLLEEGDILLARSGASVGKNYIHEVEERVIYAGYLIRLRVNKEKAIPKYVYYTLNSTSYKKFVENKKRASSQPNINAKEYSNIKITLPPLVIQKRVVDVLDKLEEMVNNTKGLLPHEIELRRKQYEYYREKLLTFEAKYDSQSVSQSVSQIVSIKYFVLLEEAENIVGIKFWEMEWKTLGEVGTFFGGLNGKNKYDFINGNCRYVPYKNIFSNIEVDLDYLETVFIGEEKQNKLKYGDILFTGSSEKKEESGISSVVTKNIDNLYLNSFCFGYRFYGNINILPNFSKYLFRDYRIRKEIIKISSGVTRYNVSKEGMKKIKIPILPLVIQKYVVSILDPFRKIVNDLKEGLPREIELRQKQYEYYREKLLDFKRLD